MSLYVEVMCDLHKNGHEPGNILVHRCWSDRNDNPQGRTPAEARREAKRLGWTIGRGGYAVCPGCKDEDA